MRLLAGSVFAAATLLVAVGTASAAAERKVEARIALVVNGQTLPRNPAPRIVSGHVLVPAVKIYAALGVAVRRSGKALILSLPGRPLELVAGQGSVQLIDGVTYVPLRFVGNSLGAQVSYHARSSRVEIVSSLIGRNPGLEQTGDGGTQIVGTASAIDLNSTPETISVERGGNVRTVPVGADVQIALQDVVARTNIPAALADVHVGDAVSVLVRRDGRVASVIARYATHVGTIAAVSPDLFVLDDGFMVSPDRSTQILLDSEPATLADLRVGDGVTVRVNPDTNEKRQIIAVRSVAATPPPSPGAVTIAAFTVTGKPALRAGDSFAVTLRGTPDGRATYDIGQFVTGLPMTEAPAGTYMARYTIPAGVNFGQTQVFGHLVVGGASAPRAEAAGLLAISTTPPQFVDVAPTGGATIDNNRPSIFATYRSPTDAGIDAASATISVNGQDVTDAATRTANFITYSPSTGLGDGPVHVVVRVSDLAGNTQVRSWSFTVRSR